MIIKRTILVVDDSAINRQILFKILSLDYNIIEAANGKEALDILQKQKSNISAVLLDLMMPEMDGYTFLHYLSQDPLLAGIPVMVTTQQEGEEFEVKALALGAYDFLNKPYKPAIIRHRLANTIKLRETSTIINTVERDTLTGIYNKEFLYQRIRDVIHTNVHKQYDIICLDVERFKLINDLFGTVEGDKLLTYIANTLKLRIKKNGVYGRISADTFIILLPHQNVYAEKFFSECSADINQYPIHMKLVIRYGIYKIEDITLPINVMCDRAKLAADSVKGRYDVYHAYYDESIRERLISEQRIIDGMKTALEEKQFKVYFQPKYDITDETIAGAEALVRWEHPTIGFMSPAEFIPLFEKNGFITDLDFYVWEYTCCEIRNWLDYGYNAVPVSVNVSRSDIYNPNLIQTLTNLVRRYDLPTKMLHLEITETAYTEDPMQLISVVSKLKSLGFVIEMDDFGTGYSSLNMLSELPIDVLKLDMLFVKNQAFSTNSKNILSFIISLGKWLNLQVVAEGVETAEQLEMLRSMDCNYVQGYYYSKPVPAAEFVKMLQRGNVQSIDNPTVANDDTYLASITAPCKKQKKKMLIVDDIGINRTILANVFANNFEIIEVENGSSALEYAKQHIADISVILLDLIMPVLDGFQTLRLLKEDEQLAAIPVIVTSQAGEGSEARALLLGADDFISKPYSPEVALRRVENVVARSKVLVLEREQELANKVAEMKLRAEKDALTGLYNRSEIETRIDRYFATNITADAIFIILDIDNFKLINDTLGHIKGDSVLRKVAQYLKNYFKNSDIIARLGGDEFVIFIPTKPKIISLHQKMERLCHSLDFYVEDIHVTCSVGVCIAPTFGQDFQTLYSNADIALLAAKRLGKNRYQLYDLNLDVPPLPFVSEVNRLLDETSDIVVICDVETYNVLYVNKRGCEFAGQSLEQCIGDTCYSVFWGLEQPCAHCTMLQGSLNEFQQATLHHQKTDVDYSVKAKLIKWENKLARIIYMHEEIRS